MVKTIENGKCLIFDDLYTTYLDSEKLHAHQDWYNGLSCSRRSSLDLISLSSDTKLLRTEWNRDRDNTPITSAHFSIKVSNNQLVCCIGTVLNTKTFLKILKKGMNSYLFLIIPITIFEVFVSQIYNVIDEIFMSSMDWQLLQNFDQDKTKNKLHCKISAFHYVFFFWKRKNLRCITEIGSKPN